jgi:hypothetical protein
MVDYQKNVDLDDEMPESSPRKNSSKTRPDDSASDIDFEAAGESDGDDDSDGVGEVDPRELQPRQERSRASITTPPKGKSTPPKPISAQPKGSATKKPATVTPIKKQKSSVKKISIPLKAPNKSMQTAITSSNKTVGSKELKDVKAQKLSQKIQNGAEVLPTSSTKSSEVKECAPMASGVPKPVAGKDAKKLQSKKQEITATKPSVPSAPPAARNTNVESAKPNALPAELANAVKIAPNPSKQTISSKVTPQKANVSPVATVKTASAGAKRLVALKTAKVPQSSKTATSSASVDSSAKSEASSSATSNSLKPTSQMANKNQQTTHTTLRTQVQTSTVPYKKTPSNPSLLTNTVQTRSTPSSKAPVSIPLEALEPTRMDLDCNIGQKQFQSTKIDLGDLAEMQPQSIQLPIQSQMSDAPPHTFPFSLQSEKPNLAQLQQ